MVSCLCYCYIYLLVPQYSPPKEAKHLHLKFSPSNFWQVPPFKQVTLAQGSNSKNQRKKSKTKLKTNKNIENTIGAFYIIGGGVFWTHRPSLLFPSLAKLRWTTYFKHLLGTDKTSQNTKFN